MNLKKFLSMIMVLSMTAAVLPDVEAVQTVHQMTVQ